MRHLLFIIVLGSFLLVSCNSEINSGESLEYVGLIKKIEVSSWMYGSHTLNDSNGHPLYALTSSTLNIDNYNNKNVSLEGNLIKGYPVDGGPPYLNVTRIALRRYP